MYSRTSFAESAPQWSEPDLSVIETERAAMPDVPLDLLPQPWRDWIAGTASANAVPPDYVLQSVLAGLGGICGAGVRIRVNATWSEPLVMWQAVVGEPSAGKSVGIAPMRRLLDRIEAERRLTDEARRQTAEAQPQGGKGDPFVPSQIVVTGADLDTVGEVVSGNPRGVLLWRDGLSPWFGEESEDGEARAAWLEAWSAGAVTLTRGSRQGQGQGQGPARRLESFPVSVLETIPPERIKAALQEGDDRMAARFLYAWPGVQPYRPMADVGGVHDEEMLKRLGHLSQLARTPDDPCEIHLDARGLRTLDGVLANLHADRLKAEGAEAAWLGRGRSAIVRLAGALELLAYGDMPPPARTGAIGSEQVEAAATLWRDYFWPHARAVLDSAALSIHQVRVRRVTRWLRDTRPTAVTRTEVRRRALGQNATADETQHVLERLHYLGVVQPDPAMSDGPGRRSNRWLVNPALSEEPSGQQKQQKWSEIGKGPETGPRTGRFLARSR